MLKDINTDRIREVMTGLEDLAVIRGDENPILDMYEGRLNLDFGEDIVDVKISDIEISDRDKVCIGCWFSFLLKRPDGGSSYHYYLTGSNLFAEYIGLKSDYDNTGIMKLSASSKLERILDGVPDLWGNEYGSYYNTAARAYEGEKGGSLIALRTVTNHWRKFADRLDAHRDISLLKRSLWK